MGIAQGQLSSKLFRQYSGDGRFSCCGDMESVFREQPRVHDYISDGDSSSFKRGESSEPYGEFKVVRKEECLGIFGRCLTRHLKKKFSSFKGIGPTRAERIGQLDALVVVQNRGSAPALIRSALWIMLDHLVEIHTH